MKKILNNLLLLLVAATSAIMVSCKDDDKSSSSNTNREFMTMFIVDNTRGKGGDYPYNCGLDARYPHGNTVHLYWYGVNDCAGYQIQMALQPKVSGGSEAWAKVQGTSDLLLDTIVGPKVLDLLIPDLQYSTDFRFAIRCLSKLDQNIKGDQSSFAGMDMVTDASGRSMWVSQPKTATPLQTPSTSIRQRLQRQRCMSI